MKARLEGVSERLDAPLHEPAELAHSLAQVAAVNRYLGGTRALLRALDELMPRTSIRILDVGCGSGDLPIAMAAHLQRRGCSARIVAADLHPQVLAIAQQRLRPDRTATLVRLNALHLPFAGACFDVATMSLTLHHFERDEPVHVLRELGRVARVIVINELERCRPNYLGARLLAATLWAGNRLTRHDGPLSVLRAFTADELAHLGRAAGLTEVRVRRRFFYRLVMTARSPHMAKHARVA